MDFDNSLAYISYKIYNQLSIHNAPELILNMFIPLLCNKGIPKWLFEDLIRREINKNRELYDALAKL